MRRSLCLLAVAASLAAPSVALAQQPTDHEAAVALFQEGKKFRDDGRCDLAIPKLEESRKKEPSIGAHYNLGVCYEKTNRKAALENYRKAEELAEVKKDDRLREIRAQREEFLAKNPPLRLALPQPIPPDTQVLIDGDALPFVEMGGLNLYFPPAKKDKYELRVSAPGYDEVKLNVDLSTIEKQIVTTIVMKKTSDGTIFQPPPRQTESKWGPFQFLGLGLIAVGAVGITYGAVSFISYRADEADLRRKFDSAAAGLPTGCPPPAGVEPVPGSDCAKAIDQRETLRREYNDNEGEARTEGPIWLTFAIGGGLAIAGGVLLIVYGPRSETPVDPGATTKREPRPTFQLVPAIGVRQQGLSLVGTF